MSAIFFIKFYSNRMVKCSWSDSQSREVVHVCPHLVRRQTLKSPQASRALNYVCVVNETTRLFLFTHTEVMTQFELMLIRLRK